MKPDTVSYVSLMLILILPIAYIVLFLIPENMSDFRFVEWFRMIIFIGTPILVPVSLLFHNHYFKRHVVHLERMGFALIVAMAMLILWLITFVAI